MYETSAAGGRENVVVVRSSLHIVLSFPHFQLNEIKIDIIEYIEPGTPTFSPFYLPSLISCPAYTDETKFRQMWQAFEWENKLTVQTNKRFVFLSLSLPLSLSRLFSQL